MIIYNKRTRNFILKKILEKEFQRKYNWKIIQKDNILELIPSTNLQKFVVYFDNNLLSIELSETRKKVLIPFVKEIVPLIDIKNKYLIITPPNGLLDL